jgi:hypothetical protein
MSVQLNIKEYQDDEGFWHIDVEQPGAAGIKGTTELRTIDGKKADHEDHIFGHVVGVNNWIKASTDLKDGDEDEEFLKKDWIDDDVLDNQVESTKNGWTARQVWGFQNVDVEGETKRMYVRNVVVKKKDKVVRAKLIYDFSPAA